MSRMDADIRAVRDLPPALPEPTAASVARTWQRIEQRRTGRETPARRRPLLVPVASAAVVLAVTVGGVALVDPARPGGPDGAPPAQGSVAPDFDAVMADLIDRAGRLPAATPGPDDLVYGHVSGVSTANGVEDRGGPVERWSAPAQMMPLRVTVNGVDVDPAADNLDVDNRNIVADWGGSPQFPTVGWIAAAPTEPEALRRYLGVRPSTATPVVGAERLAAHENDIATVSQVFEYAEPLVSTRMRVALYRLIAGLPDMTARRLTLDGRTVWVLTHGAPHTFGFALLVDAETGRTVGSRSGWVDSPPTDRPEIYKAKLPDDYSVLKIWRHAIVASVQDRA